MGVDSSNSDESSIISSINITPFVDVVLVLLVIFIVTAPMMLRDSIGIQLPKTSHGDGEVRDTLGISINQQGNILAAGNLVDDNGLIQFAQQELAKNPQIQAVIAADVGVVYGRVAKVIDLLKTAGLERFAIQVEREKSQ